MTLRRREGNSKLGQTLTGPASVWNGRRSVRESAELTEPRHDGFKESSEHHEEMMSHSAQNLDELRANDSIRSLERRQPNDEIGARRRSEDTDESLEAGEGHERMPFTRL